MSASKFDRAKDAVFKKLSLDELADLTDTIHYLMIVCAIGGGFAGYCVGAIVSWLVFRQ